MFSKCSLMFSKYPILVGIRDPHRSGPPHQRPIPPPAHPHQPHTESRILPPGGTYTQGQRPTGPIPAHIMPHPATPPTHPTPPESRLSPGPTTSAYQSTHTTSGRSPPTLYLSSHCRGILTTSESLDHRSGCRYDHG